ncbi:cupin domain-containing protein [Patescibacteria group bacterium]|nr:cupin domain-containing protein [Patescibacteria group bacterium]
MKLIKNSQIEWQNNSGYSKKVFLTAQDLNQPGLQVQQIKNPPQSRVDNHYHTKQTEIFCFLNTNGNFYINSEQVNIEAGGVLVVEPMDRHYTINKSDQDFIYICFKFNYQENDTIWKN